MTVVSRKFAASPVRNASETWTAIIEVVSRGDSAVKQQLELITGVASSIIAEQIPASSAITFIGSGARLRVYCIYDDVTNEETHEDALTWDLCTGDWKIYLPVEESEKEWIDKYLKEKGSRFISYLAGEKIKEEEEDESKISSQPSQLTINVNKLKANG